MRQPPEGHQTHHLRKAQGMLIGFPHGLRTQDDGCNLLRKPARYLAQPTGLCIAKATSIPFSGEKSPGFAHKAHKTGCFFCQGVRIPGTCP